MKNFILKYLFAFIIIIGSAGGAGILLAYQNGKIIHAGGYNPLNKSVDYLMEIKSQVDFDLLKGDPLSSTFSNVSSINLTYDISEKKLYFMNSKKYRYHINFCTQVLGYNLGLELFNTYNYGSMNRREYYLAILNYYNDSKTYTLEFVSEDQINAEQIKELYNEVKAKTFFGEQVKLFINNDHLQQLEKENSVSAIPKIYPSDLYGTQNYQVLNTGVAIGYLKMVHDLKKDFNEITSRDIIVIKGTVISLPICAAVVTNSFQTPLSHINLLTHNRGIPSAAQRDIFTNKEFTSRQNRLVKIIIAPDSLTITDCDIKEAELFWKQSVNRKPISLNYNLKVNTVQNIENLNSKSNDIVGSKAACFAELTKLQKRNPVLFKTPEGSFAIPFYFYQQHISQSTIASELNKLFTADIYQTNNDSLKEQLKKIRSVIKHEPISASLLNQVNAKIKSGTYTSFRFRSSTNIEDIKSFNGAGLYDSKTGTVNDTNKSIEDAIKDVWASVFTYRGYQERKIFNIKESDVMMGILVHRNFPEEIANGVAITKNIYRPDFPGFVVNVQIGEIPVVAPPDSVTCEQFICMRANVVDLFQQNVVTDYITHSNITNGKAVLNQEQINKLYAALEMVHAHFLKLNSFIGQACDIEFKFDKDGALYLKQIRPYK